jgi:hypothetical protein
MILADTANAQSALYTLFSQLLNFNKRLNKMVSLQKSKFRMVSSLSVVALLLITMIFSSTALAHNDGTYAYESSINKPGVLESSWMLGLHDDMPLSEMSLIMTHDTMTYDFADGGAQGVSYVTQQMSLDTQLDSGIRAFDIRLKWNTVYAKFLVYHGLEDTGFTFRDDVLKTLKQFLLDNPSETIVMSVINEWMSPGDHPFNFEMVRVINEYPDLFWFPKDGEINPKLGDIRAKIVLVRGFDYPGFIFPGIEWDDFDQETRWGYNDTAEGLRNKLDHVQAHFAKIWGDDNPETLYVTNLNMASTGSKPWFSASGHADKDTDSDHIQLNAIFKVFPSDFPDFDYIDTCETVGGNEVCDIWFAGMNSKVFEFIEENRWRLPRLGIVNVDFPGRRLVDTVHDFNFEWRSDNVAPVADNDSYSTIEDVPLTTTAANGVLDGDTDANTWDILTAVQNRSSDDGVVSLNSDGSFTYSPNANYCLPSYGPDAFYYRAFDGIAYSNYVSATITVHCVNDAPSFTASNPPAVIVDSGAQTVDVASGFVPGPANESHQILWGYLVTNVTNANLLSAGPTVNASGVLSYTPAADAFGTVTFDLQAMDTGGTANGGTYLSGEQQVTITILADTDGDGIADAEDNCPNVANSDQVNVCFGRLTVTIKVVNDNGGLLDAGDFELYLDTQLITSGTTHELVAGEEYTVSVLSVTGTGMELSVPGYDLTGIIGDCAANGTITLSPGQNATCTLINDDIAWPDLVIASMADQNLEPGIGGSTAVASYTPEVSGGNGGPYSVNCDPTSGSSFGAGATQVTCSASDSVGNAASIIFTV